MKTQALSLATICLRVTRFLLCGGLSTLVHWAFMGLLIQQGANALWATAVGGGAGALVNYGLQRRITFRYTGPHGRAFQLYLISCPASWFANLCIFAWLHQSLALDVMSSQILTTAVVAGLNYLMFERVVFND